MQIGVHVPTTVAPGVSRDALLTFAREAEARDFASLWVSDHIVIPTTTDADYPGGGRRFPIPPEMPYLEPVTMLGALAMVTTKARIGCSVFILGHRHPVAMAKMLATIDVLSGGRLIVGVGVGWWRQELEILSRASRASSTASPAPARSPSRCSNRIRRSGSAASRRPRFAASSRSVTAGTPCPRSRRRSSRRPWPS